MTTYCYPYKRGTGWRSQEFRSNPNSGANGPGGHTGFDQAMPSGTPIYAPCDGIIRNSGWLSENYLDNPWWLTPMGGDTLVIDGMDANGRTDTMPTFVIAHLFDSTAPVGKRVKKGEQIGISGNSGTATTGAHAHIEALPPNWDFNNGVYGRVDPELYFTEYPDEIQVQSSTPQEEFTLADISKLTAYHSTTHDKLNKFVEAFNSFTVQNKLFHAQSHAKLNAVKSVVDQIAKGQGLAIDWDEVERRAEAGASKALAEKEITVELSLKAPEAAA